MTRLETFALSAVCKWGSTHQLRKAQEEMAECIAAIQQFLDTRINSETLADEVADVYITLASIELILRSQTVAEAIERKLTKAEGQLVR
jgi:NTP pyrophosphatase (non-canonical NTP hydrolase)